jgi:hypothetical protein
LYLREFRDLQGPEVNPVDQVKADQRVLREILVRADLPDHPDQLGPQDRSEPLVIRDLLDPLDLEVRQVQGIPLKRENSDR